MDSSLESQPTPLTSVAAPRNAHTWHMRGLENLVRQLSPAERLLLYIFSVMLAGSTLFLLADVNRAVSVEVPTHGGTLIEGAVGTPRFINPLLSVSQTDQDLTALIYSGLLRFNADGTFTPDLAESYEISEDGTTYTFHLRAHAEFHDGMPVSADDVLYTIELAQNPDIKSAHRVDWEGVSVTSSDAHTIVFTLPHAYAPFLENTTLGILPKHLWKDVSSDEFPFSALNTHPVGSGPYTLDNIVQDSTGAPSAYELQSFAQFTLGVPNLARIIYTTYTNEGALSSAYDAGDIDSFVSSSPKHIPQADRESVVRIPLARVFGVFLNQNHAPILANASVREALEIAVDKQVIVDSVLGGFGKILDGPIPSGMVGGIEATSTASSTAPIDRAEKARSILSRGGWKFVSSASTTDSVGMWTKGKDKLSITLATADTEELVATANAVAHDWKKAGIDVAVQVYPLSEFNATILRPRSYDAILFGEVVGRSLDLFAFWHSSQRNDPGLNLSMYANSKADTALTNARAETNLEKRSDLQRDFLHYVSQDHPAVFLYVPEAAYVIPKRLKGIHIGTLGAPSERLVNVNEWYLDTERVWNIFSPNNSEPITQ